MPGETETASAGARGGFVPHFGQDLDQVGLTPIAIRRLFLPTGKTEGGREQW